jgi:PAS domain S-box-containing protein
MGNLLRSYRPSWISRTFGGWKRSSAARESSSRWPSTLPGPECGTGTCSAVSSTGRRRCSGCSLDPGREEATFDLWRRTLHPDDRELAERRIGVAVRLREFLDSEYRIVRPDGDIRWIQALGKVDYDPADQPVRMAGLCVDVTERKRAEESLRVKEAALASSINGIAISALTGRLTYVNDAFVKMWGYDTADEILGTSRFEYWQNANAVGQVVEAVTARLLGRGPLARRRDGSTFQAQVVAWSTAQTGVRSATWPPFSTSQRRQAEEARQSEERFRIFAAMP